ncbi:MAG: response regulator [Labilithrix sp.]|nr:response regulator [Labilithrix sp.]
MTTSAPLVLVADDEPSMLELVARHLRTMSDPKLEVIQASDGEEAWRLAQEHLPDLVVLDVMMPGMSGWEVCRKIREDIGLAHTGVVMLTGIGENLNQMTSPLYGADAYIDKPFEFEDFDDKVRDTLKSREGQRLSVVRPSINGTAGAAKPAAVPAGSGVVKTKSKPAPARKKPAKKTAAKPAKTAAKPAKKTAAKPAKKTAAKPAKAKPAVKKAAAKPAKKTAARKAAAKPAKKTAAKKTAVKKSTVKPAKKTAAKKTAKPTKKKAAKPAKKARKR